MCIGLFPFHGLAIFTSVRKTSSSSNLRYQRAEHLHSRQQFVFGSSLVSYVPHYDARCQTGAIASRVCPSSQQSQMSKRRRRKERARRKKNQPILFYDKDAPHYGFTNFSSHEVEYQNKIYPTSEHLFQSFKFLGYRPKIAEHIRTCSARPSVAFSEAKRFQPEVRPDWMSINIDKMNETLCLKFTQHRNLMEELLSTGDAQLIEDSPVDSFWGVGRNGDGRNELGKALVRLRSLLRADT